MASKKWHLDKEYRSLMDNYTNTEKGIKLLNQFRDLKIFSHDTPVYGDNYIASISLIQSSLFKSRDQIINDMDYVKKKISNLNE